MNYDYLILPISPVSHSGKIRLERLNWSKQILQLIAPASLAFLARDDTAVRLPRRPP